MSERGFSGDLADGLKRWVDAQLIESAQAERITAFEAARRAVPHPAKRTPVVVELLGYLGAALAVAAAVTAVDRAWPNMPTGVAIGFAAFGAAALLGAGLLLDVQRAALRRLRQALWGGSIACTVVVGALVGAQILHLSGPGVALLAAGGAALEALVLWAVSAGALLHVAAFSALAVVAGTTVGQLDPHLDPWAPGLAVWLLAAAWGLLAHRGSLPPGTNAGYLAAGLGLLVGAQMLMSVATGHFVAGVTVGALLWAGVALRRIWLVGIGAFGVIQFVPQTAGRYLPGVVAAPVAVFLVGVVLVALAVWLSRSRRPPTARHP